MEWVCECASHLQVTWSCWFSSQFQLGNFLWMQKSPGKCKSCPSICLVSHQDCVSVFSVSSILQQGGFQAIGFTCWRVYLVLEEAVSIQSPCVLPATGKLSRAVSSLSPGLERVASRWVREVAGLVGRSSKLQSTFGWEMRCGTSPLCWHQAVRSIQHHQHHRDAFCSAVSMQAPRAAEQALVLAEGGP